MFWVEELENDSLDYTPGYHVPVMMKEVLEYLKPEPGNVFLDCTVGLGGHSRDIADILGEKGFLVGIDQDQQSLEKAAEKLKDSACKIELVHDNFRHID